MIRNERRWLKCQAAARAETKAQDEAILRRITPLERAFHSLEFGLDDTAYWKLPSGYELVLMHEWFEYEDGYIDWRTYDVEIRGHGQIDLTECPLYYLYNLGSFLNMSRDNVVKLATWLEKYAADKEGGAVWR